MPDEIPRTGSDEAECGDKLRFVRKQNVRRELFLDEEEDAAATADAPPAFNTTPFAPGSGIHADLAPGFTGEPLGASPADGLPRFEDIDFPHFVGKPVQAVPERVEVTYESHPNEEVVDLPSSALLFESEADVEPESETSEPEDGVLDLRSLGAREFDR